MRSFRHFKQKEQRDNPDARIDQNILGLEDNKESDYCGKSTLQNAPLWSISERVSRILFLAFLYSVSAPNPAHSFGLVAQNLANPDPSPAQINNFMRDSGWPDSNYPYYERENGCSIPVIGFAFDAKFKPACDQHDRCYMTLGKQKSECENAFYNDMKEICNDITFFDYLSLGTSLRICHATASAMASATASNPYHFRISQTNQGRYSALATNYLNQERTRDMPADEYDLFDLPGGDELQWGSWRSVKRCPQNTYIVGFSQRVEGQQGTGDDTALNALRFKCSDGTIIETEGTPWGTWGSWATCPNIGGMEGYAIGMTVKREYAQGSRRHFIKWYSVGVW